MIKNTLLAAALLALIPGPALAQEEPQGAPSPGEIVAASPSSDWVAIPTEGLLVMTLAPDAGGNARQVIIQLMPAPFSQGWVHNIRLFARAGWYDGISVNRVQDNYVTQWGDPNYDNPEATGKPKPLPQGLKVMGESAYSADLPMPGERYYECSEEQKAAAAAEGSICIERRIRTEGISATLAKDPYAKGAGFLNGWPLAFEYQIVGSGDIRPMVQMGWPVHCYGMVGVGRNYSPDTGSGAELYTVIGHAPRHLDRNIALVGRVIEGVEHLSSLPRGQGELGFYAADEVHKRTPILTVRIASDLPAAEQPAFQYLSTESESFARYAEARANRRDPFFIVPAGGADICNIPVPVRRVAE